MSTQNQIPQTPSAKLRRAATMMEEVEKKAQTNNTLEEEVKKIHERLAEIERLKKADIKKNKTLAQEMRDWAEELLKTAARLDNSGTTQSESEHPLHRKHYTKSETTALKKIVKEHFDNDKGTFTIRPEQMMKMFKEQFRGRPEKTVTGRFTMYRRKYKKKRGWGTYGKNTYNKWVKKYPGDGRTLTYEDWKACKGPTARKREEARKVALQAEVGNSP